MTVDWTKPIQTRGGKSARLLFSHCMSITTNYPRVCVIGEGTDKESVCHFTDSGLFDHFCESTRDIINVPEEKVLSVLNVYTSGVGACYTSRAVADEMARPWESDRTHVVTITRCGDEVTATVEKVK